MPEQQRQILDAFVEARRQPAFRRLMGLRRAGIHRQTALGNFGLAIAAYIAHAAYSIGMEATDMLMDKEMPDEVRLQITRIVEGHNGVHGMHDLRTRRNGMQIHISFDIEVDPDITLRDAHEITRELEGLLLNEFPNADIIIHKDPKGDIYDARHRVQGIHH